MRWRTTRCNLPNRSRVVLAVFVACLVSGGLAADRLQAEETSAPSHLRVIHLSGSPYELGYQHGTQLRDEVRACAQTVVGYFRRYFKVPLVRTWLARWWLNRTWRAAWPHVSNDRREELHGLADGSGVPLKLLYQLHAIPDRTYACANFAAWGPATAQGRLIHVRNLDWKIDVGIQRYAIVFVVRPRGKRAYVNIGWAGLIGVLTGINDAQLSIGQIGAETVHATFAGEPMMFLMRRVLEEAGDVEEAAALIVQADRTVGVNYVIADAKAKRAIVVETTQHHARVFEADDPKEHGVSYARPLAHAVFRADTAMDPTIRQWQLASNGDPDYPGLEDPRGSSAYDTRYLGQAEGIQEHYGRLDVESAQRVARSIAPSSNVQSVIFAWPEVWVANAEGAIPAARTSYERLDVHRLLIETHN